MTNIVTKCIEWNKARYEQKLDINLAFDLSSEELIETLQASTSLVDFLDGIGDTIFVAIGILWKAEMLDELIHNLFGFHKEENIYKLAPINPSNCPVDALLANLSYISVDLNAAADTSTKAQAMHLAMLSITICLFLLEERGLRAEFYNIVDAICNSNNTKSIPNNKVDPSIKANIDKGSSFVPPTEELKKIITKYMN